MIAAELAMLAIAHPIAGMVGIGMFVRCQVQIGRWQRKRREDKHVADVRAWRELPDITRELRPVPVVRREPLPDVSRIQRAEAAGRAAELAVRATQTGGVVRHRAADPRDVRRYDWRRDTEVFECIAEAETGARPVEHGPKEPRLSRIAWEDEQPPMWEQAALDVGMPT